MIAGDVAGAEGDGLRHRLVASQDEDGVEVVWWKGLLMVVVLQKVMDMVKI